MLEIIKRQGNNIVPSEHVLLIEPFKTIWEQDNDEHKSNAIKDFTFIEFMVSPTKSNPYRTLDKNEKEIKIKHDVVGNDYKPSKLVYEAIEKYEEFLYENSFSYSFLKAAISGAEKLKQFLHDVDLTERTKGGSAIYKPQDITRALIDTEKIIANLQGIEKRIFDEIEARKTRGNVNINPLEE